MLYAAKCYWPGITPGDLEPFAARVAIESRGSPSSVLYRGSLLFGDDDLVLCLFEAPSAVEVKRVSERVGIPCERVMGSMWVKAGR